MNQWYCLQTFVVLFWFSHNSIATENATHQIDRNQFNGSQNDYLPEFVAEDYQQEPSWHEEEDEEERNDIQVQSQDHSSGLIQKRSHGTPLIPDASLILIITPRKFTKDTRVF